MLSEFVSSNPEIKNYFFIIIFILIIIGLIVVFIYKNYVITLVLSFIVVSSVFYYLGVYTFAYKTFPFELRKSDPVEENKLFTAYHDLILSKYFFPKHAKYGGIDYLNNQLIYLTGSRKMYVLEKNDKNIYNFKEIIIDKIPNNHDKFIKKNSKKVGKFNSEDMFGVKDILVSNFSNFNNKLLLASSNYYDEKKD